MKIKELRSALASVIPTWPEPARAFGWNLVEQLKNIERGTCQMAEMPKLMAWQVAQIEDAMQNTCPHGMGRKSRCSTCNPY